MKNVRKKQRNVKKNTTTHTRLEQQLALVNPTAAGIDVGSEEMWVCVPEHQTVNNVRRFGAFTCDLQAIADWLTTCGVTSVAMESTGIYWIPLYQILEARGFTVCLVNARQLKNVSGRPKTDRLDCRWLQRLHTYGLLMASFRPPEEICQLRCILRHRDAVIRQSSKHVQHMQKALHQMNLLLDKVVTDITGVTGMTIITHILDGERNPVSLATLRNPHCKSSEDAIAKALTGDYHDDHIFVLRQAYDGYHFAQRQVQECDKTAERWLHHTEKLLDVNDIPLPKSTLTHRATQHHEPPEATRQYLFEIYGVDLTQVPGFQAATIQTLLAEVGRDMRQWPTAKHFTSWLGLCPNLKRSGGKDLNSHTRKVQSRAALAFRNAARTVTRSKTSLGAFYRRLKARLGPAKALTATARKLAVIFYTMVKDRQPYRELGQDYYEQQLTQRQLRRLKKQAAVLGYTLTLTTTESSETSDR